MQVFVSCLICTGVWSNLYVNLGTKCPKFKKCPIKANNKEQIINNKTYEKDNKVKDIDEIKKIFKNN